MKLRKGPERFDSGAPEPETGPGEQVVTLEALARRLQKAEHHQWHVYAWVQQQQRHNDAIQANGRQLYQQICQLQQFIIEASEEATAASGDKE